MPEGPSLIIAREELSPFIGKRITAISGSSKIDQDRLLHQSIREIRTWGKHLLLCFEGFTIRVHFLMFGTYYINSTKDRVPRLHLRFGHEELNLYACAVKMLEEPLDELYDWSVDVLSPQWDAAKARRKLKALPDMLVTDALLDQTIFSGVGNIIKNEALYRISVHPESRVGALPPRKLTALVTEARNYTYDFLAWKREGVLRQNWLVHKKKVCPRDATPIEKEYFGLTNRRTFFCPACQQRYT
jgi:endonuclease-8